MAATTNIVARFLARIGTCRKCMRESFLAAAGGWAICLAAIAYDAMSSNPLPLGIAAIGATALTVLWLIHLTVFAFRAATSGEVKILGATRTVTNLSRRNFVTRFAAAFGGVAVATIVFSPRASAENWLRCVTTFCEGDKCCPDTHRYLSHCDCHCYESSSDFDCRSHSYCSSAC